jgi:Transposase zinc-ribbon domain
MLLNIQRLMDDAKCYEVLRELRWQDGVKCPACDSGQINKRGFHDHQANANDIDVRSVDDDSMTERNRLRRASARLKNVDTVSVFVGLSLSSRQIAAELDLNEDDVQVMASQLREGVMAKKSRRS